MAFVVQLGAEHGKSINKAFRTLYDRQYFLQISQQNFLGHAIHSALPTSSYDHRLKTYLRLSARALFSEKTGGITNGRLK